MEVRRVPNQGGGTLREFYASRAADPESRRAEIGQRMLALLDRLVLRQAEELWARCNRDPDRFAWKYVLIEEYSEARGSMC